MTFTPDISGAEVRPSSKLWPGRKQEWPVSAVVQHFTASLSEKGLINWMQNGSANSAHIFIFRSGRIIQMVPFESRAFHAGEKMAKGFWPAGTPQPTNVNQFSIGIENCNVGWLLKSGGKFNLPVKTVNGWEPGKAYKGPSPVEAEDHRGVTRWWEPYSKELIASNILVLKRIVDMYPSVGRSGVGFHSDVSPHRKTDPGPLWPHSYIMDEVFNVPTVVTPALLSHVVTPEEDEEGIAEVEALMGDNAEGEENPEWHYDDEEQMSMVDRVPDLDICIEEK